MKRIGFKMKLHKGMEQEYQLRHDKIWPELVIALKAAGVSDYVIFLDVETGYLFGTLKCETPGKLDELPQLPIMKKWWAYMKDIMDTNADYSPVSIPLQEMFYLP
ncbi:MAG: L-rhamnose mutarotase [Bacteroidota bacterium]